MAAVKVNKEQLIEAVKNFPCLYDTSRKEYKDDLLRENAWSAICAELFGRTYNDKDLLVNCKKILLVFHLDEVFNIVRTLNCQHVMQYRFLVIRHRYCFMSQMKSTFFNKTLKFSLPKRRHL